LAIWQKVGATPLRPLRWGSQKGVKKDPKMGQNGSFLTHFWPFLAKKCEKNDVFFDAQNPLDSRLEVKKSGFLDPKNDPKTPFFRRF